MCSCFVVVIDEKNIADGVVPAELSLIRGFREPGEMAYAALIL